MSEPGHQSNGAHEDQYNNNNSNFHPQSDPRHPDADDDDTKTLITANELLEKTQAQVTYQHRSGFDDDSATLVNNNGLDDSFNEGSSSSNILQNGKSHQVSEQLDAHIRQLRYNDMKVALDRSINTLVDVLGNLQKENNVRPIYYPTDIDSTRSKLNSAKSRLALIRKNSLTNKAALKQADDLDLPMSSEDGEGRRELNVLNLNLKIDQHDEGIITNLDKESLASLLNSKVVSTVRHLLSLKERIDDTSSKVFVTGDLNAGKTAFCNALLRKKLLPEDEQPCTNVFCEVINVTENEGREEVHAVPIGVVYKQRDQSTYRVFSLKQLETLVYESDKYAILKIYVNDNRPKEQSLLKNNIIDISLIDAPGLNMDSYQTTEVFSRQEEIDLVVFVVDARNHFTLSGKEFISTAAKEKNFIFIVVNKFDTVRNKEKCQTRIMEQVANLSPDTHKDSHDFVHFVSCDGVLEGIPGDGPGDDDDPGNDDNDDDPYSRENPDFDRLEYSLRKFILEKRSLSKLLPAKNYTLNVLKDLEFLFRVNEAMYLKDREEMLSELNELTPKYESTLQQSARVHEKINKFIESVCNDVYNFSKERIQQTVVEIDDAVLITDSPSLDIYSYAVALQQAMIDRILEAVNVSEAYARKKTSEKVEIIKQLGVEELGSDFYNNRVFRDDLMFTKKRDSIQKKISDEISPFDFFDPSVDNFLKLCGNHLGFSATNGSYAVSTIHHVFSFIWDPNFLRIGTGAKAQLWKGSASAVACVSSARFVTQFVSVSDLISPKYWYKISKPLVAITGVIALTYLILDMPSAFQRNTAKKISTQISKLDYQHKNSNRIAKEVRTVLNHPARDVLNAFQTNIDKVAAKRDTIASKLKNSDLSSAFYSKNLKLVINQMNIVKELELESLNRVD